MSLTRVKSTSDLMSIALQAERFAVKRYAQLAIAMRQAGNEPAAALFERMVIEEQEHERSLLAWMEKESIEFNPDVELVRWRDPQVSTTYNDEARDPDHSSPYRALAFAVNNEENAFRFYTHVAAESEDQAVRQYAEMLAREELGHAALFRVERRRAYHRERDARSQETRTDPAIIHGEADLLAVSLEIDRYLCAALSQFESDSPELADLARNTRKQIDAHESRLDELQPDYDESTAVKVATSFAQVNPKGAIPEDAVVGINTELHRLSVYCDQSFVFYDAVVENTVDESTMRTAQALSAAALDRISALRQVEGRTQVS